MITDEQNPKIKRCPGLSGVYCGEPKAKGQGYCRDHQAEYQRNRYRKIADGTYQPREYKKRANESDRCKCCGNFRPKQFVVIQGKPEIPPICADCLGIFNVLKKHKMEGNLVRFAEFVVAHARALTEGSSAYDNFYQDRLVQFMQNGSYATVREVEKHYSQMIKSRIDDELDAGVIHYNLDTDAIEFSDPYKYTYEQLESWPEFLWDALPSQAREYYSSKSITDDTEPEKDTPAQAKARAFVADYEARRDG